MGCAYKGRDGDGGYLNIACTDEGSVGTLFFSGGFLSFVDTPSALVLVRSHFLTASLRDRVQALNCSLAIGI